MRWIIEPLAVNAKKQAAVPGRMMQKAHPPCGIVKFNSSSFEGGIFDGIKRGSVEVICQ
jgi:hypothetical protein